MSREVRPLTRSRSARRLGGVCGGIAAHTGRSATALRVVFAVAALAGGFGVLVYAACWLILPDEHGGSGSDSPAIVALAQACAAAIGLTTLAAAAAAATLFGFGWIVLVVACAALVCALAGWPRVGAGWALLPVLALALPAAATAATGLHIQPQAGDIAVAPRVVGGQHYRTGLGRLFVDLRRSSFPASGTIDLRVDAGVVRTLVALPHDRCVHVEVRYDVDPAPGRMARTLAGRFADIPTITAFERVAGGDGTLDAGSGKAGPTLRVHFTSQGGSLVVRDYPDSVEPRFFPDWPGSRGGLEPRPDTSGTDRHTRLQVLREWRALRAAQHRQNVRVLRDIGGPCAQAPR